MKPDPKARPITKAANDVRLDRKSSTGVSGAPKKSGHGGKFTWSGDRLSDEDAWFDQGAVDAKDPNFEEPESDVKGEQLVVNN